MAVTITVTSPTGSDLPLHDLLLAADVVTPLTANADDYWLAASHLGNDFELRFNSSTSDLSFDVDNIPVAGNLDSLEIYSVSLGMVIATVAGFSVSAQLQQDYIIASHPAIAFFVFGTDHVYTGDTGNDKFVVDNGGFSSGPGTFDGGDGDDYLQSAEFSSDLSGGKGNDTLIGGTGYDKLDGGDGDDVLRPGQGFNDVIGGDGFDTADYSDTDFGSGIVVDGAAQIVTEPGLAVNDAFDSIEKFIGTKYADKFIGDAAARIYDGGAGNDTVAGGSGDEWALGGAGADIMDGGEGRDTLAYLDAVTGVTVTLGAPGKQTTGKGGDAQGDKVKNFENVIGGNGNDKLTGNNLENRLFGTKGDDTLLGSGGNDILNGGEGKDTLDGGANDDFLEGGEGADKITGNTGIDTVTYENSTAAVTVNLLTNVNKGGEAEGDTLFTLENIIGSDHDDTITGNALDNIIEGGAGADTITGGGGKDTASYKDSQDGVQIDLSIGSAAQTSTGDGSGDKLTGILNLIGSLHADKLTGDGGDNTIEGGDEADELDGGGGIDTLRYASSVAGVGIQLDASGAGTGGGGHAQGDTYKNFENVTGSAFDDVLTGNNIVNVLKAGAGNDFIEGYGGADIIDGGDGIDGASYENSDAGVTVNLATGVNTGGHAQGEKLSNIEDLYGSDFKDKLTGNALANTLNGGGDDDFIDGGAGNDKLYGAGGNDTILGNAGDDLVDGGGGADVMDGGANIDTLSYSASAAVKVKLGEGSTALIQSNATKVTVNGVVDIELGGNDAEGDSVKNFENLVGSSFDDVLVGNSGTNKIEGGLGKDNIDGGKGNDTIFGGFGNDKIFGGDGDDVIEGGAGADAMDGGLGKNTLSYAADTAGVTVSLMAGTASNGDGAGDTFMNFHVVRGGSGDDIITGDAGANTLEGGGGNDNLFATGGKDTLDGGADFDTASFETSASAVTIALKANGVATKVASAVGPGSVAGTTLKNIEGLLGSDFNDKLTGNASKNDIFGGEGDDLIEGGAGADMLHGGNGIDTLSYAGSKAAVSVTINGANATQASGGDAQDDTLTSFETLVGSKHDDKLISIAAAQVNVIKGGAGNDVIEGGEGADLLFGEAGSDTLSYASDTAGVVVILQGSGAADVSGSVNAGNHAAGDVATGFENLLGGSGSDFLTGDAGANIIDGGNGNNTLDGGAGIDTVSYATAASNVTVTLGANGIETTGNGTGGGDSIKNFENITGTDFNDELNGNNLANALFGGAGDDTLIGGGGADVLDGGEGLDAADYSAVTTGITLTLGKGGAAAKVSGAQGADSTGDTLIRVEMIVGGSGNDKFTGNELNNIFYGGDGDDWMEGGAGADQLVGMSGIDTVSYAGSNAGVTAHLGGGSNSGGHAQGDQLSLVENLIGSKFNDLVTGGETDNAIFGGAGNDYFNDSKGKDSYDGGAGTDTLDYSNWGGLNITVALGAGGAQTTVSATGMNAAIADGDTVKNIENVYGGQGDDKLIGNALNNTIAGSHGNDYIDGGLGNDLLDGGLGMNTLSYASVSAGVTVSLKLDGLAQNTGGAGIDTIKNFVNLIGSSANDRLIGSSVANKIEGGEGNDTVIGGGTADTLIGGDGIDTVSYEIQDFVSAVTVDLAIQDGVTGQSFQISDASEDVLSGFENLTGSNSSDKLHGDGGANVITGLGGNDTIEGRGGADILDGGTGDDTLSYASDTVGVTVTLGANGQQTIATGPGGSHAAGDKVSNFERITGGGGNDKLIGNAAGNIIIGGDGDDYIEGGLGDDVLSGGMGVDTLSYAGASIGVTVNMTGSSQPTVGAGDDVVDGSFEILIGSSKNDHLTGNAGMHKIEGGDGDDIITSFQTKEVIGGNGNDLIKAANAQQLFDGGAGIDTLSYELLGTKVTVDLNLQGIEQDVGLSGKHTLVSIENLTGSKHDDTLTGDGNANVLEGGDGSDTLTGGLGNDIFVYNALFSDADADTITDFGVGADKIQISKSGFNIPASVALNGTGVNNFGAEYFVSGSGAFATASHGQFVFDTDTFRLYWDEDGLGGLSDTLIAEFGNGYILTAADFTLV